MRNSSSQAEMNPSRMVGVQPWSGFRNSSITLQQAISLFSSLEICLVALSVGAYLLLHESVEAVTLWCAGESDHPPVIVTPPLVAAHPSGGEASLHQQLPCFLQFECHAPASKQASFTGHQVHGLVRPFHFSNAGS